VTRWNVWSRYPTSGMWTLAVAEVSETVARDATDRRTRNAALLSLCGEFVALPDGRTPDDVLVPERETER
jgi:hypothetical protein